MAGVHFSVMLVVFLSVCSLASITIHAQVTRPVDYSISTIFGGANGDGFNALNVGIGNPLGLAVDTRNGNVYYSDSSNRQVRYFDVNGTSHLFAGSPYYQYATSFDGLAFANISLYQPYGVAFNSKGEVLIVDNAQSRVKKVVLLRSMVLLHSAKLINPRCIAISPIDDAVYVCEPYSYYIKKIVNNTVYIVVGKGVSGSSPDGTLATNTYLQGPISIAFHPLTGEMYFSDMVANKISFMALNGSVYTYASNITVPRSIVFNTNGDMYVSSTQSHQIVKFVNGTKTVIANSAGILGFSGDGGNALNATLNSPSGLAIYANTLFISDTSNKRIRTIDLTTNIITTVAGDGSSRYSAKFPGYASEIPLSSPLSTFYNTQTDELFVTDTNRVLRVKSLTNYQSSIVDVIAGNGIDGVDVDGKLGNQTSLTTVYSVFQSESTGDVFIGTVESVLKVSNQSQLVTTIARSITSTTGDGFPAVRSVLDNIGAVALSASGEVYFSTQNSIRKIDLNGILSKVTDFGGTSMAFLNSNNDFVFTDYSQCVIRKYTASSQTVSIIAGTGTVNQDYNGEGLLATATNMHYPYGICVNSSSGEIYYADSLNKRIRKIGVDGRVNTVIGFVFNTLDREDGLNASSTAVSPLSVAIHPITKELYFSDEILFGNIIRKLDSKNNVYTVMGFSETKYYDTTYANSTYLGAISSFSFAPNGDLYFISSSFNVIKKMDYGSNIVRTVGGIPKFYVSTGDGPAFSTSFSIPQEMAVNSNGEVFFAANNEIYVLPAIRKLSNGMITTIAGSIGDGNPAFNATIQRAFSVAATDSDVYLSDGYNYKIRKISLSTGIITSVVGGFSKQYNGDLLANQTNIAFVNEIRIRNNEIFFTDSGNNKIRKTDLSGKGMVTSIAGNGSAIAVISENIQAREAVLNNPQSFGFLPSGELIIADTKNHVIRKIDLNGNISLIAGQYFQSGFNGDYPNAKYSLLGNPKGISILKDGRIVFIDSDNIRVRVLIPYCPAGYYMTQSSNGVVCNLITCNGIAYTDSKACSGNGVCQSLDTCTCSSGYIGSNCEAYYCNNVLFNSSSVCSSHGTCTSPNACSCANGYTGSNCETYYCNGILYNATTVCSVHGYCIASNNCSCSTGYLDTNCNLTTCYGVLSTDSSTCSGNGVCKLFNGCSCNTGYFGLNCANITSCYGIAFNDSNVCSGKGACQSMNTCSCISGYSGLNCSTQDISKKEADYCSLYPTSFVCSPSSSFNTTETQITKVSNITDLDSKTIEFSSTSTISISLPSIISQYLQTTDNSLKNDSVQVVSSIAETKSSKTDISVISPIVSLVLLKSSSNEKITVQNLAQPISLAFENITLIVKSIETLNISCVYFDEDIKEWKSDGMQTEIKDLDISNLEEDGNITVTLSIRCNTNHLTSFSVIDQNYKKAATKPTQPTQSNQPTKDAITLQDNSVIIGAVVGVVGGVCVIGVVVSIIIIAICLLKKRKKAEIN